MTRAFDSLGDFLAMGGYALYVWLAVAMTVLPLLALALHARWQHRAILRGVVRLRAREARRRAHKEAA